MTLNEVLEITNKVVEIDGEKVYFLEGGMTEGLENLADKINKEKAGPVFKLLSNDMKFISIHPGFALIFRAIQRNDTKKWLPCLVYKYGDEWRRVVLQNVECLECDWKGIIANPTHPDLYLMMENKFDILKKITKLSFCKCPKCGSRISGQGIWVMDKNS